MNNVIKEFALLGWSPGDKLRLVDDLSLGARTLHSEFRDLQRPSGDIGDAQLGQETSWHDPRAPRRYDLERKVIRPHAVVHIPRLWFGVLRHAGAQLEPPHATQVCHPALHVYPFPSLPDP